MDGVATYAGLVYWDGYFYYINSSGKAVKNRTYWPTNTNGLLEPDNYHFDEQGRMVHPPEDALTESISTFALGGVSPVAITHLVVPSIPPEIN